MNKDNNYIKIFNVSFGQIAYASFLICVVSGIFVALPYDVSKPFESISKFLLVNENAKLIRSIHYWSAQFFLVFTLFHFWDHLRLSTEKNVTSGMWIRLILSILIVIFLMLSGFILKGDEESIFAQNIFSELINTIPLIGESISFFLLGTSENFQTIYLHHIATATILLLFFIIEHAKIITPSNKAFYITLPLILFVSSLLSPNLHDKYFSIVKGPWYLVGVQEILHWLIYPSIFLLILLVILILLYLLWHFKKSRAKRVKKFLFVLFVLYTIMTVIGFYLRNENWEFCYPWQFNPYKNAFSTVFDVKNLFTQSNHNIKLISGRYEGCLSCHENVKGLSPSHDPEAIGCVSCHLGNPFTLNKNQAHSNMILIPGNLSDAKITCGRSQCHSQIVERVNKSLMNTMSGVVSVDKFVFDEINSLDEIFKIQELKYSPADTHLRNLCASCHLSNEKNELGSINQLSRGGGCNACHLYYSKEAESSLQNYKVAKFNKDYKLSKLHPDIKLPDSNNYCFGCHSRSGRISTNYEGWHETELNSFDSTNQNYRQLDDGRIFVKTIPDIHYKKGMLCIDCHISSEIMGDGNVYSHKEQQVKIQCIDCHIKDKPVTKSLRQFDYESKKIAEIRKLALDERDYLIVHKSGEPLINTFLENNEAYLIKKRTLEIEKIKKPLSVCFKDNAHKNLSCNTCHTSWSPQCTGCHTEFNKNSFRFDLLSNEEMKGEWIEHAQNFIADYPALGVKVDKDKKVIDNFVPGMILTIDKDKSNIKDKIIFKRLYAPAFSHTIRRESRSCKSCHLNPSALGYGRGKLEYKIIKKGNWIFTPEYPLSKYDGLPMDAWIGFLQEPKGNNTTRNNMRPFTLEEQKKILEVGACLMCHAENSEVMKQALVNYESIKKRLSDKCIIPD
ncbi:hypothetical protein [Rosettibacter firmus]|uniref:hypothetical protein n=1 Tax=Rosettibacter firmus TaxID=3111522 RepID=UPI00336C164F